MAIFTGNINLLVAAPVLQDYLVDKTGIPMAGGTITCYHDNSRTTLKNWYYQSGIPGNYTYITLPNPLTLSAAGTICDINGVDTIPFFYPYDETNDTVVDPYYITIANYAQTNQITRANFPFLGNQNNSSKLSDSLNNLIVNNGFWRNIAPNNITNTPYTSYNLSSATSVTVAPSQHDGFRTPDVVFAKNNTSATDAATFIPFPLSSNTPIVNFVSPEYYVSHNCTVAGTAETQKYYQFPISLHINSLANVPFTFSIQAQNSGGTSIGQNVLSIYLFQDTGTGTTAPAPTLIGELTLNSTWTNYTITDIFPATAGLTISNASDDALYLQIGVPLNATCTINFTKPSIFLTSDVIPNNDFRTYDQVDSIISSPRTGDIRMSLNRFYPYGWVPMNDGSIGNVHSNASAYAQQDGWSLFNLLWGLFSNYDNAGTNLLAQMYSSAGSPVAYGASALADWNANKAIALTKTMGRVILGTSTILNANYTSSFTSSSNLITTSNTMLFFNGMPVYFSGTTNLSTKLIYYVTNFNGTNQFNLAASFANAMAGSIVTFANDSGTILSALQGSGEGEYSHTQLLAEIATHNHTVTFNTYGNVGTSPLPRQSDQTTTQLTATANVGNAGSSTPFNVTQPGTFYNMFIKL